MQLSLLLHLCVIHLVLKFTVSELAFRSTNMECLPNPKLVVNATCRIKALNWNKAVANMDCFLLVPLRNTSVHLELFKKDYNNQYHPFLVNVVVNMCDIISRKNYATYGIIFWKILQDYTNVNHSCPISGHLMARGIYIDAKYLPVFPIGFYKLSIKVIENYIGGRTDYMGSILYYVQVMEMVKRKHKP